MKEKESMRRREGLPREEALWPFRRKPGSEKYVLPDRTAFEWGRNTS